MATAICKTNCYFAERGFEVGEFIDTGELEVPPHFEEVNPESAKGKRVYNVPKPKSKPVAKTAHQKAQEGEPVALSQLIGNDPVTDDKQDMFS